MSEMVEELQQQLKRTPDGGRIKVELTPDQDRTDFLAKCRDIGLALMEEESYRDVSSLYFAPLR